MSYDMEPFPGSPDDMMSICAALREENARLKEALKSAQAALSACGYVGYAYNEIDAALATSPKTEKMK